MAELVAGLVVDALISAAVEQLFERLASTHVVDFIRGKKVDKKLLEDLQGMLTSANEVLDDAEKKMIMKPRVREWLVKLQDEIYNAEDLVYEINTEALQRQLEGTRQFGCHYPVCNLFSSRFSVKNVENSLKNITGSLKGVVNEINNLGLRAGVETSSRLSRGSAKTSYMVRESDIYGRDADKEAITKFLLSDEEGRQQISVMPIVGMAGIGKTTLALLAYNNFKDNKVAVEKPFDVIAWITVSDESDVYTLTKAIYKEVVGKEDCTDVEEAFKLRQKLHKAIYKEVVGKEDCTDVEEAFKLQQKLHKVLEGKKFFFVLDDVWNLDYGKWSELRNPLESAAHGSKIVITTRSTQIASVFSTVPEPLDLQLLKNEDCWKLFSKHAFSNEETTSHPNYLEEIGRQIAEKCKGVPLALKSLACLLHGQQDPREWQNVLESDFWELPQNDGDILPALWLSYYYLPRHLKRCFAYCSIFPKDYEIEKEKLILLWMAEDLLQSRNNMTLEEIGEQYLKDLTSRSFFQVITEDGKILITMHDLVNDLAKFVSGESCLRLNDRYSDDLKWKKFIRKARHVSYMQRTTPDIIKNLKDLSNNKVLRTLLVDRDICGENECVINPKELQSMQYLRVLSAASEHNSFFEDRLSSFLEDRLFSFLEDRLYSFEDRFLKKLFKSVGNLKLLLYLDLSGARIKKIPHTICRLHHLQTLLLSSIWTLAKLPHSIGNLKHLRYLDLSSTGIQEIPDTIGALHNLQKLLLRLCHRLAKLPDSIGDLKNLRSLDLSGTSIKKIPDTIGALHNLQKLLLRSCVGLEKLPDSIGDLKNLRYLDLSWTSIEKIPDTVCNLQELRVLDLKDLNLGEMPRLMSKLKHLQTLTLTGLDIGKNSGSNVEAFGKLEDVGDYIQIKILDNEIDGEDVLKAILKGKKGIRYLRLEWEGDNDDSDNKAREMLDRLQPHTNIEELHITNYGGRSFSDWVGHHSFSHIESVLIKSITNCRQLPPLGQLPSLKRLNICGCDKLEKIGNEFYSSSSSSSSGVTETPPPFESLEILKFSGMPQWEEWSFVVGAFSNLRELELNDCPKLNGACLPEYLPSLTKLKIFWTSPYALASLAMCEYPSLWWLEIHDCLELKSFPLGRLPSSIRTIEIRKCGELVLLSEEGWPCSNLETLAIIGCDKLFADSNNKRQWNLGMLTSLTSLTIENIDADMDSFPEEEGQLPTSLTFLTLDSLENLKSLNESLKHLTSLQSLKILSCRQLECLPEDGMPASLNHLHLHHLPNLKSLNANTFRHLTTLERLDILECPQVQCLPEDGMPASLTYLYLRHLPNLKSLNANTFRHLTTLKGLMIRDCPQVQCLPEDGMPASLNHLHLHHLPNLKSLNANTFRHLTTLKTLDIMDCPRVQCLPEDGLPASLMVSIDGRPLNKRCQKDKGREGED